MSYMEPEERRALLEELSELQSSADTYGDEVARFFLPLPLHGRALDERTFIVRGERGAGKTALFQFLTRRGMDRALLQRLFPRVRIPDAVWVEGFSEGPAHPSVQALDAFGKDADDEGLRALWTIHLVGVLATSLADDAPEEPERLSVWRSHLHEPSLWLEELRPGLGGVLGWLDEVERRLAARGKSCLITYDHLDRIGLHQGSSLRERYAGTLLSLWQSLTSRYRRICPKVFLREDLFAASQRAFTDASKLEARSVALLWDQESLYRLLIRHMAGSERLRGWLQRGGNGVPLREDPVLGWLPPEALPETGRPSVSGFAKHLAGESMGEGVKKGRSYRWILNHLQDAHVRVVPRSLLNLIGIAAREALERGPAGQHDRLLDPTELAIALDETSRRRVKELEEEHPVVRRLRNLSGLVLMLDRDVVEERLAQHAPGEDGGFGDDGRRVTEELIGIGVLRVRPDGRIDVPDLYRYGFDIKRKGGVRRPV